MSDELKQRLRNLWSFSTNQEPNPFKDTPEYKAGVEDAIARIEFLWYCYKHGPADQDTWDTMDTIAEVQAMVELLLEE